MDESTNSGLEELPVESLSVSKALDPSAFYSLYLGGITLPERQQRIHASSILMLSGRLGLRPGEIQHLHEGWIDWERGVIRIPERDPCACRLCWETARCAQRAGDGRQLVDIVTETMWSSPGRARTVPFAWSQRLTAILGTLCDEEGYLDLSAEVMLRLIKQSAKQAQGLAPEAIDFESLRATAGSFFSDAGFPAHRVATLLGEDIEIAHAFAQKEGGDARSYLSDLFDDTPSHVGTGETYPLLADSEPFEQEPFDASVYDTAWRQARAKTQSDKPTPIRTPRPTASSVADRFDPETLGTRAYLDTDSEVVDQKQAAETLGQWVSKQEEKRHPEDPPSQQASTSSTETEIGTETEQPTNEELLDPRDRIEGSPVLSGKTTLACSAIANGQPTSCHVILGSEELLFARDDAGMSNEYKLIDISDISDISIDHVPSGLENVFDSTVAVAYDEGDGRQVAVLGLSGNKRIGFAKNIFNLTLDACALVLTHPAQQGGRVMDTEPTTGELTVDDRSLSISVADEDITNFSIQLSDIMHIEMSKQRVDGKTYRGLSVQHLDSANEAIKTKLRVENDRKHKLFERFIKQNYRERKQKIEQISLTDDHKEVLVALYTAGDQIDISIIIDKSTEEIQKIMNSLRKMGLVRSGDNGMVLTGLGRVVVNEKIEDVNM